MKVIGYIRVSTQEQAESGLGLAAQEQAIEMECSRRGYDLVDVLGDSGFSAKNLKRPSVQHALERLERHDAEALMVAKLDRLSRSLLDFAALMETARRQGWSLVALDLGVDTSTPSGEMMASVLATFAQFERRLIGQRTKDALAVRRSQGVRLGRPPALPTDVVANIVELRNAGATYRAIASELNRRGVATAQGGRAWHPTTVHGVVRRAQGG